MFSSTILKLLARSLMNVVLNENRASRLGTTLQYFRPAKPLGHTRLTNSWGGKTKVPSSVNPMEYFANTFVQAELTGLQMQRKSAG